MKNIYYRAVLLILLTGCAEPPLSVPELLAGDNDKVWLPQLRIIDGKEVVLDSCTKDDKISFHQAGGFLYNYGIEKCTSEETDSATRNWTLFNNGTYLRFTPSEANATLPVVYEIIMLDEFFFRWRYATTYQGQAVVVEEEWEAL